MAKQCDIGHTVLALVTGVARRLCILHVLKNFSKSRVVLIAGIWDPALSQKLFQFSPVVTFDTSLPSTRPIHGPYAIQAIERFRFAVQTIESFRFQYFPNPLLPLFQDRSFLGFLAKRDRIFLTFRRFLDAFYHFCSTRTCGWKTLCFHGASTLKHPKNHPKHHSHLAL